MATEYISREAAIRFFNEWRDDLDKQIDDSVAYPHLRSDYKVCKTQLLDCIHAIEEIPTADVRPVVLCRDCIYGDPDPSTSSEIFCEKHCRWLSKDHYCASGMRRWRNG